MNTQRKVTNKIKQYLADTYHGLQVKVSTRLSYGRKTLFLTWTGGPGTAEVIEEVNQLLVELAHQGLGAGVMPIVPDRQIGLSDTAEVESLKEKESRKNTIKNSSRGMPYLVEVRYLTPDEIILYADNPCQVKRIDREIGIGEVRTENYFLLLEDTDGNEIETSALRPNMELRVIPWNVYHDFEVCKKRVKEGYKRPDELEALAEKCLSPKEWDLFNAFWLKTGLGYTTLALNIKDANDLKEEIMEVKNSRVRGQYKDRSEFTVPILDGEEDFIFCDLRGEQKSKEDPPIFCFYR